MLAVRPRSPRPLDQKPGRVHLLHIGKTGGTAVKTALKPYRAAAGIKFHPHRTKLEDIPRGERVVFFLRDPVKRFVSAFNSRFRQGQPRYDVPWNAAEEAAFSEFQRPDQLATALSSTDRNVRSRAQAAMIGIRHVKKSYHDWFGSEGEFRARLADVMFIGFQEELATDFEALKVLLGIPEAVALPDDEVLSHRSPTEYDKSLSAEAEANLRDWYAEDLRFYAYCRELRRSGLA